jgi:aspartate-semialdehyde dehydrogenase
MTEKRRIAVVGATGMVGRMFLKILEEHKIVAEYSLFASARSAGTTLPFFGKECEVQELREDSFRDKGFSYALFSAGGAISAVYAPLAAASGAIVIDNSSQWRMDPLIPLVVPEVNPDALSSIPKGIVANPNCSTIQAVVPLKSWTTHSGSNESSIRRIRRYPAQGKRGIRISKTDFAARFRRNSRIRSQGTAFRTLTSSWITETPKKNKR